MPSWRASLDRKEGGGLLFQPDKRKKGDKGVKPGKRKPLTPEELQKRLARSQAAMAVAQTRRQKAQKDAQAGKLDLLAYIALNGGMRRGKTWPGSTLPEHLRVRGWEFLPVFSERAPMTWSQMAEMARGDGWFPGKDDDGNSSWSEETFINAVSDALDGSTILHPNAYTEQSVGGFESELDWMERELWKVEQDRLKAFSDPSYFRAIAETARESGDVNVALYNEMLADAVQAGRELPEGERRMMQWAALLDKLLPDRRGTALVNSGIAEGLDLEQINSGILEAVKQARGITSDAGAAAAAGSASSGSTDSGATGSGSVAEVPAADPADSPDLSEQQPDNAGQFVDDWLPAGRGGKTPSQHMAQAHAYDSETAQELQQLVDRLGSAAEKRTWRQVTLEEFRVKREAVEQLWFQGRRANKMVVEGRRVRIAAAAGELAARLEDLGLPERAPGDRGTETRWEQFRREGLLSGFASVTRVEHWAESLGPVSVRYVFRPIADGLTAYRKDRNVYVQRYEKLLRAHRVADHQSRHEVHRAVPPQPRRCGRGRGDDGVPGPIELHRRTICGIDQAIKRECLSKLILFGEDHLRRAIREFVEHYHEERPHQGLGNRRIRDRGEAPLVGCEVVADERLGGLLRSHRRSA